MTEYSNKSFALILIFFLISVLILSAHAFIPLSSAQAPSGGDWNSFTLNYNDSRYQASSTITSSNVGSLREAWFFPSGYSVTSTPIVENGHVYFADWGGNVYSLNIATGSDSGTGDWKTNVGFSVSSTLALANGLVYVAGSPLTPTKIIALHQNNGTVAWAKTLRTGPGGIYSSPIVYNGLVYIGISDCQPTVGVQCSEFTASDVGEVEARNAMTGDSVWNFTTGNSTTDGGFGAGVWGSVVIDPTLNSIYFGTGNSFVNTSSTCLTCSLYAYSIISLDATTGKLNWYYQVFKNHQLGDDSDFGSTPNLFLYVKNGVTHQAIGLGNKNNKYYVLDRQTGKLLAAYKFPKKAPEGIIGVGGFIYPSGTNVNPEIFLPSRNGTSHGVLEALKTASGKYPWYFSTPGQVDGSVALVPGAVLFGDSVGNLYALATSNGAKLFHTNLPNLPSGYGIYGGVTVAEGFVLVGDFTISSSGNSGGVYAFARS